MSRPPRDLVETLGKAGGAVLLAYGCWRVLQPFAAAILYCLAITVSTWPAFLWLLRRFGGRRGLASAVACLAVALLVIAPMAMLVVSLGEAARWALALIGEWRRTHSAALPDWLASLPVVGELASKGLRDLASGNLRLAEILTAVAEPAQRLAMAGGKAFGWGLGQALFAGLLLFFAYRDGQRASTFVALWAERLGGARARSLLVTAQNTVQAVMLSVVGAGLAQAAVATLGFAVAGIPNPFLLGALTFISSMLPVGPPLIWLGATFYLFRRGDIVWAVVMALYGFFAISSVDNIVKPLLISRSSRLPFILTFIGVLGGVLAFGVPGVLIGPTVLALALNIGRQALGTPAGPGEAGRDQG